MYELEWRLEAKSSCSLNAKSLADNVILFSHQETQLHL